MLYIASALNPTPVIDTLRIDGFTNSSQTSLVVAKPDRLEVWDVDKAGLTFQTELKIWGNVISIAKASLDGTPPHILVLTSPPNAQLLLLGYQAGANPSLSVTSSILLTPPTPSLRQAEYFNAVISKDNVALVSLWTGVIACVELEIENDKEANRRRSSVTGSSNPGAGKRMKIRDQFNINIREHNLLQMAFMPSTPGQAEPSISVLWQSSTKALLLQSRTLSLAAHSLEDKSASINVVTPISEVQITSEDDFDFSGVPYSCPAARHVLPISADTVLIIGDEYSVLYRLHRVPSSPRISRASISSASGTATSPRASATRRSPQNEMAAPGKRRKSSTTARRSLDAVDRWEYKPVWRVRQGFGTILAASVLESHETGATVIISDESGRLTAFGWEIETKGLLASGQKGIVRLSKVELGIAPPASSLSYLDASHLFLASSCGDSMLVELQISETLPSQSPSRGNGRAIPSRKGKDKARESEEGLEWALESLDGKGNFVVKERWMNLAPLRDFCVVKDEGGGMSHLVAASGAASGNSLRTIRSGVGLEDRLSVEGIRDVTALYNLGQSLLVSTRTSSFLLDMTLDPRIAALDSALSSSPTLAVGRLSDGSASLVSPRGVSLCALNDGVSIQAKWTPSNGAEIVAAGGSRNFVVVARKGGEVTVLQADGSGLKELCNAAVDGEISAVSILDHASLPSPIVAISTWPGELLLYTLDHLRNSEAVVTSLREPHHAVSLVLRPSSSSDTSSGSQLLAGLSDGTMVNYDLEIAADGGGVKCINRKTSGLGTRPLQLIPVDEIRLEETIIGVGLSERVSVVFESKGRLDFSTVNRKGVTAATAMKVGDDECLVLASPAGLSFTSVSSLKKLSVQTLDLHDRTPIKVVSLPELKVLGVGSIMRQMDAETGEVVQKGYFELRDQTSLKLLVEMPLEPREQVTSLKSVFLLGRQYLAIGTALFSDDEIDEYSHGSGMIYAKEGKLYLAEVRQNGAEWEIVIKTSVDTMGAVHDIAEIHGFLAMASASKVSILRLDASPFEFKEVSQFASAFVAQHLYVAAGTKARPDARLVVGDGLRSIFVLEVDEESGTIYADHRDLATYQVMGLEGVQDNGQSVILADGNSNLLTLRLNDTIETAASFGLHEPISQFRQGSLVPQSSAPDVMLPELLFGTVDGRLGVIGELTEGATATLNDLQRNMAKYHTGPGGVEWRTWRRAGTEMTKRETAGFVDGDFVQRFLDLDLVSLEEQNKLVAGTNQHERVSKLLSDGTSSQAERADVVGLLEALAGLH